jgi:hypothetical protein
MAVAFASAVAAVRESNIGRLAAGEDGVMAGTLEVLDVGLGGLGQRVKVW